MYYSCAVIINQMKNRGIPSLLKKMKTVIAFGNPLLDTSVVIADNSILDKYSIKEDEQKEILENDMRNILKDISGYEKKFSAGGCSQNSLRVLQWVLHKECKAIIFGSVGKDNNAEILKNLLHKDGVETRYIVQDDLPTGTTIALIKGASRALLAHLGAAEKLPLNDLLQIQDLHSLIQDSNYVYVEGYFLTKRIEAAKYILNFCNTHNKTLIFNISGTYVCELIPKAVQLFAENANIVCGNRREFFALAKIMNFKSVEDLTNRLINNGKHNNQCGTISVITDSENPVTLVFESGEADHFEVISINEADIVDTTGAGDAFAGGFLAGLCKNKSLKECVAIGCYSAFHLIKQRGCTIPNFRPDILD